MNAIRGFTPYHFFKKSDTGFTSIELLVALVFIGALGGVAYSVFDRNHTIDADNQRVESALLLQNELARYFDAHGGYPSALSVLHPRLSGNTEYHYAALNTGCTSYHLGVRLENENHSALSGDVDAAPSETGNNCPDGGESAADFSGADPIYDLKP